jgi:drug/metabolite transporter (DMT)-like permease
MASLSIVHWLIFLMVIAVLAGPMLGIIRGVKNSSISHTLLSAFIPVYGLIYFFAGKRRPGRREAAGREQKYRCNKS